jgi:hypothetical protein
MAKNVFKPGGFISGQVFEIDNKFLTYKNAYGKKANVPISAITTVTIDAKGMGKSDLKIIGHGTELATITMPSNWCEKAQSWILDSLNL